MLRSSSSPGITTPPVIVPPASASMPCPVSEQSPCPPNGTKYLMNDIPRGTSLTELIKCLQPPGYTQPSRTGPLPDVQVDIVLTDSRLDDELSVATIDFHHPPPWLIHDPYGFPKFTPLGTLWKGIAWNATDSHGRTEFIRAVTKQHGNNRLCYAEMLAEFPATNINMQDETGRTALHWACALSHADMVMLCLSVPECQIGLKDNDGLTAFDIALRNATGNEAIPTLFYRSIFNMEGIQPQAALLRALTITSERVTGRPVFPGAAMFAPVEEGNEVLVEALINRGVDLTATNEHGDTALHVAAANADNLGITRMLLDAGSDVNAIGNRGATPLHYAVETADVRMVQLLLHHDADRSATDDRQRTARHLAGKRQDLVLLFNRATTYPSVRADRQADSKTAVQVHLATQQQAGQAQLSEIELKKLGQTSLFQAVVDGDLEIVRLHLRLGVDLETKDRTFWGWQVIGTSRRQMTNDPVRDGGIGKLRPKYDYDYTALLLAAPCGHTEIVKALLSTGADVDAQSGRMETALYKAAEGGHIDVVNTLLAAGADVQIESQSRETALHQAAKNGYAVIVDALLSSGADVDAQSSERMETALYKAARGGHTDVVNTLLASSANIHTKSQSGVTALHEAARNGHTEIVEALLSHGADVDAQSTERMETALYKAAQGGHTDVVTTLLANGANIDAESKKKETALSIAAGRGHIDVVKILLASGANIHAMSQSNETALHQAAQNGHTETVQTLIADGADKEARCMMDETPLQKAVRNKHRATSKALWAAGAHNSPGDRYKYAKLMLTGAGTLASAVEPSLM